MRWSENITVAELGDEPMLSDELRSIISSIELSPDNASHLVLNFQDVTYVNSSNIGQFIRLRKLLAAQSKWLVMCCLCEEVHSVIRVTGIERLFRFAPDPLTALTMLQIEEETGA